MLVLSTGWLGNANAGGCHRLHNSQCCWCVHRLCICLAGRCHRLSICYRRLIMKIRWSNTSGSDCQSWLKSDRVWPYCNFFCFGINFGSINCQWFENNRKLEDVDVEFDDYVEVASQNYITRRAMYWCHLSLQRLLRCFRVISCYASYCSGEMAHWSFHQRWSQGAHLGLRWCWFQQQLFLVLCAMRQLSLPPPKKRNILRFAHRSSF